MTTQAWNGASAYQVYISKTRSHTKADTWKEVEQLGEVVKC